MDLDGRQLQQLREALLSAFPTRQDLEMVVLYGLNENLSAIAGEGSLQHTVFELIRWATARARLEELVIAALKQNSLNAQLVSVAQQLGLSNNQNVPHVLGLDKSAQSSTSSSATSMVSVSVYLSYSRKDQEFAEELVSSLKSLMRRQRITILDRPILAGTEWSKEIDNSINEADIILLLISSAYIASDYAYSVEMQRTLERQQAGEAIVLPILVRPVDWKSLPFKYLRFLPSNGIPITRWPDRDEAFLSVIEDIRYVVEQISEQGLQSKSVTETTPERVISSLPRNVLSALKAGKTANLQKSLEDYARNHRHERLILQDGEKFLYYENIAQVIYIWQIWHTITELKSVGKKSQYVPLFEALVHFLITSLNASTNANTLQEYSQSFFFTFLDMPHMFTNLSMPKQIPLIFYINSSFDMKSKNELHDLMKKIAPSSRVAILLFFMETMHQRDGQRLVKHFRETYAYDIVPMTCNDLLTITEARNPRKVFRQWLLSQTDLSIISPFTTSGPTFGRMFFGREQELRTIQAHAASASYALIGGRRIGKTSILRRLERIVLPEVGYRAFYQDCSYIQTPAELLQSISLDPSWFSSSPPSPLSSFIGVLQALPHDKPLVFLIDEADKLIKPDKAAGYPLLNSLRALANAGRCQFVFSGEHSLRSDIQNPYSPLYNFANVLLIGHLDTRAVRELVIEPMHDLEIELEDEEKIVGRIWDFTAGHPNVIQRLCQRLVMKINRSHQLHMSLEDVEEVIANSDFLRDDFLETYWGQATLLEQLCTLLMAKHEDIHTLVEIQKAILALGLDVPLHEVNKALDRLVNLRNLLRSTTQGYAFAVMDFPRVFKETCGLDDQLALLRDQYKDAVAQQSSMQ